MELTPGICLLQPMARFAYTIEPVAQKAGFADRSLSFQNAFSSGQNGAPSDVMSSSYTTSYPRQHLNNHTNGTSTAAQQSDTTDLRHPTKSKPTHEPTSLAPARINGITKKHSDLSVAGSDTDSLLDLYKNRTESRSTSRTGGQWNKRKPSLGLSAGDEGDDSYWIHRDKLAQIESRELEEAGIRVGHMDRQRSRTPSKPESRPPSRPTYNQDQVKDVLAEEDRAEKLQPSRAEFRADSELPLQSVEQEPGQETINFELRTPEEVAAEREAVARQQALRVSTSRIPISKSSPVPVPHTFIERDSPLPRSRKNSGAWSGLHEDGIALKKVRSRSQSVGSQVLLDEYDDGTAEPHHGNQSNDLTSSPSSPVKAKVPSKALPTSGGRKATGARVTSGQTKARAMSGTHRDTSGRRPGTSSGPSRPSTSHNRPEGDAPWIATMYKPDPRLPPEQQMLPTHAKRLAQEQWEKDGRSGSVYDKDFNLLSADDLPQPETHTQPSSQDKSEKEADLSKWPLPSPELETRAEPAVSNTPEPARYKTTPSIQPQISRQPSPALPSPGQPSPAQASSAGVVTSQGPVGAIRVQDPPEKQEKKSKMCGCCVVM